MNSTRIFDSEALRQQVMSPVATAAGCIPIKLDGKKNFKKWINILAMHMSDINLHWYQYAQNGKLNVIIEQYNPSNDMIAYIKKLFETALKLLIVNNVEGSAKKEADRYVAGDYGIPTGKGLLNHLTECFGTESIDVAAEPFFQLAKARNLTLDDQYDLVNRLVEVIFETTSSEENFLNSLTSAQQEALRVIKIKARERAASLFLMSLYDESYQRFMDIFGKNQEIKLREVYDVISNAKRGVTNSSFVGRRNQFKQKVKNFNCKRCGGQHKTNECPEFQEWLKNKRNKNHEKDYKINNSHTAWIALISKQNTTSRNDWYFDTGCTQHISHDRSMFCELVEGDENEFGVIEGIGGKTAIKGIGTVQLGHVTLYNVAYVPDGNVNLISVKMASSKSNMKFIFDKTKVYTIKNNKITQVGEMRNQLYVFMPNNKETKTMNKPLDYAFISYDHSVLPSPKANIPDAIKWHARVGHPGLANYNRLANRIDLPIMEADKHSLCPTCSLSKGVMKKGKISDTQYTSPLQLLQVDICGQFRYTNFSDSKYFLTIRDAYSRYYSVIHLASKSAACDKLIEWILETENHFKSRGGFKVGAIRTDNGREFMSSKFHNFCKSNGISHQLTVPYNSFQNGAVERSHRSIEEKTRCLLIGGKVPPSMWTEAVSTAVYLLNRLPVSNKNYSIPYCLWNNIQTENLDLSHLRIFGCAAYATLPHQLRDGKFAPTSVKCVFVGYDSKHKAYRLYHPPSKKIFVSNQVRFDELDFPLAGTKEVEVAHTFATGTLGGVPVYPSSTDIFKTSSSEIQTSNYYPETTDYPIYENNLENELTTIHGDEVLDQGTSRYSTPYLSSVDSDSFMFRVDSSDNDKHEYDSSSSDEYELPSTSFSSSPISTTSDCENFTFNNLDSSSINNESTASFSSHNSNQINKKEAEELSSIASSSDTDSSTTPTAVPVTTQQLTSTIDDTHSDTSSPNLQSKSLSTDNSPVYNLEDLDPHKPLKNSKIELADNISAPITTHVSKLNGQTSSIVNHNKLGPIPASEFYLNHQIEKHHPKWDSNPISPGKIGTPAVEAVNIDSGSFVPMNSMDGLTQLIRTPVFPSSQSSGSDDNSSHHIALTALVHGMSFTSTTTSVPNTFNQAMSSSDKDKWYQACLKELQAFKDHDTYRLTPLPPGRRALGSRWVFNIKDGNRFKARLVAQGHTQKAGIDYQETFAPVVRYDSVRIFLAISALLNLRVHQMDVDTAFLNSKMEEPVYVRQPPGFVDPVHPNHVWQLYGGMYGLKQAPLLWNTHIHKTLSRRGFTRHDGEYGIYFKNVDNFKVLIALYVDDLLIAAPNKDIMNSVKAGLNEAYSMKDLGPVSKFLGMNVYQDNLNNITISMEDYITKAAQSCQIDLNKNVEFPLSNTANYFDTESPAIANITEYQSIVGQLLFVSNVGRPDVAHSVQLLSRFLKDPREVHLKGAYRVMQYLYKTKKLGLSYNTRSNKYLEGFSDASHGNKNDLKHATGGFIIKLAGGVVTWSSKKITSAVCLSSTDAEYISASNTSRELIWIKNMLNHMKIDVNEVKLWIDNEPAIHVAKNPVLHSKMKHVNLHYHFIRHQVESGIIEIGHINTTEQIADIMTKVLPRPAFIKVRDLFMKKIEQEFSLRGCVEI
ncbi:uncharacterized protein PWA37_001157 [Arxiozyma heterogenica]|uniref:uncharacterized protein n=1 Tax=Arxiozyma heterogenica TaxID=278026 RepID=UPI002EDC4712